VKRILTRARRKAIVMFLPGKWGKLWKWRRFDGGNEYDEKRVSKRADSHPRCFFAIAKLPRACSNSGRTSRARLKFSMASSNSPWGMREQPKSFQASGERGRRRVAWRNMRLAS